MHVDIGAQQYGRRHTLDYRRPHSYVY